MGCNSTVSSGFCECICEKIVKNTSVSQKQRKT